LHGRDERAAAEQRQQSEKRDKAKKRNVKIVALLTAAPQNYTKPRKSANIARRVESMRWQRPASTANGSEKNDVQCVHSALRAYARTEWIRLHCEAVHRFRW
jgi:hypothetical protein